MLKIQLNKYSYLAFSIVYINNYSKIFFANYNNTFSPKIINDRPCLINSAAHCPLCVTSIKSNGKTQRLSFYNPLSLFPFAYAGKSVPCTMETYTVRTARSTLSTAKRDQQTDRCVSRVHSIYSYIPGRHKLILPTVTGQLLLLLLAQWWG